MTLTQEYVSEQLDYDPETGELSWKLYRVGRKMGMAAGSAGGSGYLYIGINGKQYLAHRLVWLLIYGYFPENDIDHINRVKSDNRLSNLREVSRLCNSRNCGLSIKNTSGVKGIYWYKRDEKWRASIKVEQKDSHLGYYEDLTEAVAHRLAAEQCLNWAGCESNSSAFQYMKKETNNEEC